MDYRERILRRITEDTDMLREFSKPHENNVTRLHIIFIAKTLEKLLASLFDSMSVWKPGVYRNYIVTEILKFFRYLNNQTRAVNTYAFLPSLMFERGLDVSPSGLDYLLWIMLGHWDTLAVYLDQEHMAHLES